MKGIVNGLEFVRSSGDDEKCVGCLEGKMARKPFPPSTKPNATEPLKLVHTDLCGQITPASKGGARYVLTLLDDATRMCWIRLLKTKDATSTAIKQWVADVETESGFKVKRFRSDGGGEYTARELGDWLKGRGTAHEFSTPYTPQQNGAAERLNRTLMESARSLLSHAHAEKHWWGEAVTLATWIHNRCVTKALPNKTPLEAWSGTKPDVTDLRTFGCTCYYHVPDATRTKLEAKARVAMYLGPSADHKGWRVWDLEHGKLVVSRDVVFYEDTFPSKSTNVPSVIIVPPPLDAADEADDVSTAPPPRASEGENGSGAVGVSEDEGNAKERDPSSPPPRITPTLASTRTRRNPHPNSKFDNYSLVAGDDEGGGDAMCLEAYTDTPSTYHGAMSSAEAAEWERALQEELRPLCCSLLLIIHHQLLSALVLPLVPATSAFPLRSLAMADVPQFDEVMELTDEDLEAMDLPDDSAGSNLPLTHLPTELPASQKPCVDADPSSPDESASATSGVMEGPAGTPEKPVMQTTSTSASAAVDFASAPSVAYPVHPAPSSSTPIGPAAQRTLRRSRLWRRPPDPSCRAPLVSRLRPPRLCPSPPILMTSSHSVVTLLFPEASADDIRATLISKILAKLKPSLFDCGFVPDARPTNGETMHFAGRSYATICFSWPTEQSAHEFLLIYNHPIELAPGRSISVKPYVDPHPEFTTAKAEGAPYSPCAGFLPALKNQTCWRTWCPAGWRESTPSTACKTLTMGFSSIFSPESQSR
ncbi:unnamed protein product [Closterium sp. Yama58-4]|nr:unnamed protein product [Closterium sp. Yama58-4]